MRKKLIIIGRGRGANQAKDVEGEKWSANYCKPWADILFDIHTTWPKQEQNHKKAKELGQRLILQKDYPLQEIIDAYGIEFFPQSIAYMIALGIYKGFKEIDLYGCNIIPKEGDEPIVKNHPGTEFWIGFAMGKGIKVTVQGEHESFILRNTGFYGYEDGVNT